MEKLVLINFSGNLYGVRNKELLDIKKIRSVHRLPLRQVSLAGIGLSEEGRTVTLFDLGVCMGHGPFDDAGPGMALVVAGGERLEGFIVGSDFREAEVASGELVPMPECLTAPEIDRCALIDGEMVPVINVGVLYEGIVKNGRSRPCMRVQESAAQRDPVGAAHFRVFGLGGLLFAMPGESIESVTPMAGLGRVRPMPLSGNHIEGIVLVNGRVSAAVNPADHLGLSSGNGEKVLFLERSGGFGLVADSDIGVIYGGSPKPMPPLVSSDFMGHGLVHDGEVIPLIDVRALLSAKDEEPSSPYAPTRDFESEFGKKDVGVLEFSLSGVRHSLPSSEVEEIAERRPYRRLSGGPQIALGVVEHKGEILPVIDLSFYFGGRAGKAGAKMALVRNGDFRAFLMADEISESPRTLKIDEQRRLPIRQSRNFVYGCYLDGPKVRLILNVEALATNFVKKEAVGDFNRMVEDLEKTLKPQKTVKAHSLAPSEKAAKDARRKDEKFVTPDWAGETLQKASASIPFAVPRTGYWAGSVPVEILKTGGEARQRVEGKAHPATDLTGVAVERKSSEVTHDPPSAPEKPGVCGPLSGVGKVSGPDGGYMPFSVKRDNYGPEPEGTVAEKDAEGPIDEARQSGQKLSFDDSIINSFEPVYHDSEPEGASDYLMKKRGRRRRAWGAIAAAAVLAFLYFALWPVQGRTIAAETKKDEKAVKEAAADKTFVPVKEIVPTPTGAEKRLAKGAPSSKVSRAGEVKPVKALDQKRTLLLEITPARREISTQEVTAAPIGAEEYTVVRGDTLWRIAKRFTGDPFQYHKIAANSRIENPDLIMPGQEIFIRVNRQAD